MAFVPGVAADLEQSDPRDRPEDLRRAPDGWEVLDFVEPVSVPLPTQVIAALFAFQPICAADFRRWFANVWTSPRSQSRRPS